MKRIYVLCLLLLAFCISSVQADVKLPAQFSDHMVLQQKEAAPVWGWAEPGEKVKVTASWGKSASTKADSQGKWKVKLRTPKAGGPYTLTIDGNNKITIKDVLIGEVWICSGQSNMEMGIGVVNNAAEEIAAANYPNIRLFDVDHATSLVPLNDVKGNWVRCTPETVANHGSWGGFSAAAYFFGRKLHTELDVPIGLIATNWGGTVSEAWTSPKALKPFKYFTRTLENIHYLIHDKDKLLERYESDIVEWEKELTAADEGSRKNWQAQNFDDSNWKDMVQPQKWSESDTELKNFDGIVWFRLDVDLPASMAGRDLEMHLGPIDDSDSVWLNGKHIVTTLDSWYIPRVYTIPASALKQGKNAIAVRIIDTAGDGGFDSVNPEDMRIGLPGANVSDCVSLAVSWKYKISRCEDIPNTPKSGLDYNMNTPTVLYNAMLSPLIPYRIAGAIWYQGESNRYDPILYRDIFPAMITNWRHDWGQGKFPFYFVQIAPFQYFDSNSSGALRETQSMTLKKLDNVGMAVTMDIGEERDIHPKDKLNVGERLARLALAKTYKHKKLTYSGPLYKSMKVKGDKAILSFDYVCNGLVAKDGPLTDFVIAGEDKIFVNATAVIDGDKVVVSSPEVSIPVAVRYGWAEWCQPNLFNADGLPASSFRTDDWPLK